MLRNILGPIFNLYLEQFLTHMNLLLVVFAEAPIFIVFSAQQCEIFKETQQRKKDTICEHNCANCSCQNVRICLHFSFLLFLEFPFFRDVFDEVSKNQKITKYQSKKKKQKNNNKKKYAKQKQIKYYDSKQNKTRSRKKQTKTKEQLERKKQTKQKEKARTRYRNEKQKGRKKEKNKRETKKEKVKKEEAPKRLKRNKGRHRIIHKNALF